jgi:hypothetical protein
MPAPPVTMSLAVVEMAQEGRFTEIRDLFAPTLRAMVTATRSRLPGPSSSTGAARSPRSAHR